MNPFQYGLLTGIALALALAVSQVVGRLDTTTNQPQETNTTMKTFTETLIICGDYREPIVYDNPDIIPEPYQRELPGRHCNMVRIFTERQKNLSSYQYDFEFRADDEDDFFDGLEANGEWYTFDSLYFAADDLRSLMTRGIIVEETEESLVAELYKRAA